MPNVRITCPDCKASFSIDESRIKPTSRGVCPKCNGRFLLTDAAERLGQPPSLADAVQLSTASATSNTTAPIAEPSTAECLLPQPAEQLKANRAAPVGTRGGVPETRAPVAAKDKDNAPEFVAAREALMNWTGKIQPVKTPFSYRGALFVVMIVMILLPLLYVALIGCVGVAMAFHLTHDAQILSYGTGRGKLVVFIAYFGPIIAGAILIFFMVKPLFARPARANRNRAINENDEPLLFSFIERLCKAVGAPRPRAIEVDCQVNASAGFRRGYVSLLTRDLVLVIGLPLVSGLTLKELAGVIAHEFGHFAQGAGMRASYVIRRINGWFSRVVYERDEWDIKLRQWAAAADIRYGIVLYLAMALVFVTRKILWCFMMAGHAVSCHLMRQMEFDADRHETRLAGTEAFCTTSRKIRVLGLAFQGAMSDLGLSYREGRLVNDLPQLIQANVLQIPPEALDGFFKEVDAKQTEWFDTHPAHFERIASARRENAAGILPIELPATALFSKYLTLCRSVTREFYGENLGALDGVTLVPVESVVAQQQTEQQASKALDEYFSNCCGITRPLVIATSPEFAERASIPVLHDRIQAARRTAASLAESYQPHFKRFNELDVRIVQTHQAMAAHHSALQIKTDTFPFPAKSVSAIGDARRSATADQEKTSAALEAFERAVSNRLTTALHFYYAEEASGLVEQATAKRDEITRLIDALRPLVNVRGGVAQIRQTFAALGLLAPCLSDQTPQALFDEAMDTMKRLHEQLVATRSELLNTNYPFEHAKGDISLGCYLLHQVPARDHLGRLYSAADQFIDNYVSCYYRILGRLVVLATEAEKAIEAAVAAS